MDKRKTAERYVRNVTGLDPPEFGVLTMLFVCSKSDYSLWFRQTHSNYTRATHGLARNTSCRSISIGRTRDWPGRHHRRRFLHGYRTRQPSTVGRNNANGKEERDLASRRQSVDGRTRRTAFRRRFLRPAGRGCAGARARPRFAGAPYIVRPKRSHWPARSISRTLPRIGLTRSRDVTVTNRPIGIYGRTCRTWFYCNHSGSLGRPRLPGDRTYSYRVGTRSTAFYHIVDGGFFVFSMWISWIQNRFKPSEVKRKRHRIWHVSNRRIAL